MVLFPEIVFPVTIGRPAIDRGGPAGGARAAPGARRPAARSREGRSPVPTICTASARSPTSCATSPRRTAATTSSARACSASGSPTSSRAIPSWWRAACTFPSRQPTAPRSRRASCCCSSRCARSSTCCPRRRRSCARRSRRPARPACWPTSPPPTWTPSPRRSRTSSRRSISSQRLDKVSRLLAHRLEVLRLSAEIGKQTKASLDERQREMLLREQMAAIQKRARRGRLERRGDRRARKGDRRGQDAVGGRSEARKELRRLQRMPDAAAEYGMIRTYLDWLIELPWAPPENRADRHRRGAPHPRRGPLRPGEDQDAHRRVSGGAQARARGQGADPVLRRPARRRQDLARPVDRPGHGPQVRARQPGRRA